MDRVYRLRLKAGNHFDRVSHKLIRKNDVFLSDIPLHKTYEPDRFELLEVLNGPPDNDDIEIMRGIPTEDPKGKTSDEIDRDLLAGKSRRDKVEGDIVIRKVTGGVWPWEFIGIANVGDDKWYIKNVETGKRISPRKIPWKEASTLIEEYLDDLE